MQGLLDRLSRVIIDKAKLKISLINLSLCTNEIEVDEGDLVTVQNIVTGWITDQEELEEKLRNQIEEKIEY